MSEELKSIEEQITLLKQNLDANADDCLLLNKLGMFYRRNGQLDEAATIYSRLQKLSASDENQLLDEIFNHRTISKLEISENTPSPFVKLDGFFSDKIYNEIYNYTLVNQANFQPAIFYDTQELDIFGQPTAKIGNRISYTPSNDLREVFINSIYPLVPEMVLKLGMDSPNIQSAAILLAATGNAQFGQPHRDDARFVSSSSDMKQIACVYYFHKKPKGFRGGDLLLHDTDFTKPFSLKNRYTRIKVEDNMLVAFPGAFFHEIAMVNTDTDKFEDSRFAISFWVILE